MRDATFNRVATVIFAVLGVIGLVVGAGFALGADYFGLDPRIGWLAGLLFMAVGAGMLIFVAWKGTWTSD